MVFTITVHSGSLRMSHRIPKPSVDSKSAPHAGGTALFEAARPGSAALKRPTCRDIRADCEANLTCFEKLQID